MKEICRVNVSTLLVVLKNKYQTLLGRMSKKSSEVMKAMTSCLFKVVESENSCVATFS